MNLSSKLIISAVVIITAFAVGRYSARSDTKTQTQVLTAVKTDTVTKTIVNKKPSGETTTTTIEEHITDTKRLDKTTTEAGKRSLINLSALGGLDTRTLQPVYGISANKEFIGPITVGAWGLTNGSVGVSVGWTF